MRRIVTAITAAAMALSLVSMAMPANAVAGYDSAYAGESAFLTLQPGTSGTFTVFFQNTGTTAWTKGTASQVDLAACLEDKVTCNAQDASEAPFNSGWLSTTRYASHTQTTVSPGSIGTFTYNVMVPASQAAGTYRFNGALVLSATGADIHNEGYYQDVTVPTATGSCTPTAITTTPTTAQNQVGVTHTQSATVTCAIPTGSTTAPPSVGTQVTFVVDAAATDTGNADLTLTAVTDANGLAQVTWTRSNPGTDTLAVYPTSTPSVRATATKRWVAGAFAIACEPTGSATQLSGSSRTFTVTVRNPSTGALATSTAVDLTTTASIADSAIDAPSTIAGVSIAGGTTAGTTVTEVTTGSTGTAVFSLVGTPGAGTNSVAVTVRAFVDNSTTFGGDADNSLDTAEFRVDCGTTTFENLRAATITVTPDTTATNAANGNRVYTVTAVDQFGNAFTGSDGKMLFSFTELTDSDSTTTTTAIPRTQQSGGTSPTPGTTCSAATGFSGNQKITLATSTNGTWFVQICSTGATTGTPIAWYDSDSNGVPGTNETQDTGGAKTWATPAITSAAISPTSATNTASSESPITNNGSLGEEQYSANLADQSGNFMAPTNAAGATVTFTVRNTSSTGDVIITECRESDATGISETAADTTVEPNTTATCVVVLETADTTKAVVEIDKGASGTATIDTSIVHGGVNFVATQATKTWVSIGTTRAATGTAQTATGKVVAADKSADCYTIETTSAGNFTICYSASDTFSVDGSSTTIGTFETNLTIGDNMTFRNTVTGSEVNHALTNQ